MTPDFPHNIGIWLAQLKFFLLHPDVAMSLPCWLSQFRKAKLRQPTGQRLNNVRGQQKKFNWAIIFLYHEESLVSPNLNSKKQLRFHSVRLNFDTFQTNQCAVLCTWHSKLHTSLLYHYLGSSHVNQTIHNGDISFLKSHSYFSFNFSFTIQDLIRLYSKYWDHAWTYPQPNYGNTVFGNVYLSVGQH